MMQAFYYGRSTVASFIPSDIKAMVLVISTQFQAKVIPPIVEDTKNLEILGSEANQESFSTLKIYSTTR